MQEKSNSASSLWSEAQSFGKLCLDNARFTLAQKTTLMIATMVVYGAAIAMSMVVMVFLALALVNLLEDFLAPGWVYLILAGVFILLITLLFVFKMQLVFNPIARFISKLFIDPPTK